MSTVINIAVFWNCIDLVAIYSSAPGEFNKIIDRNI